MSVDLELRRAALDFEDDLATIAQLLRSTADRAQGNGVALLKLLRMLEAVHQEVREDLFQESLPSNRQALHALLKDIEAEGGWPYINRMRLQDLLVRLKAESPVQEPLSQLPPAESVE